MYTRDSKKVLKDLVKTDTGSYITKSGCYIHTPKRTEDRGLTVVGVRTYVYAQCAIINTEKEYGYVNAITRLEIDPSSMTQVTINDVDYYEFYFEPGSTVIKTSSVIKDDKILYYVLDEFVFQAKAPWYMSYQDRLKLFHNVAQYVGLKANEAPEIMEVMVSITARHPNDDGKFFRQLIKDYKEMGSEVIVPFSSVQDSVQGTIDRITGNYFEPAVTGALVSPSKSANRVEQVLT